MGNSSAQPSRAPEIGVCPFLGRESEEENGAPTPLNLPRGGGDDLRPSPVFRCLALAEPIRVDAGRQRRLCLSPQHSSCRRFGDAESRNAQAAAKPDATVTPVSAPAEEIETDVRIGRIRRRFRSQDHDGDGPRARVTVAGQPVDFTPMTDAPGDSPSADARDEAGGSPTADRLGALWDDQVELDRLGSSQNGDEAEKSDEPPYSPSSSPEPFGSGGPDAGAESDAASDSTPGAAESAGWVDGEHDDWSSEQPPEHDFESGGVGDGEEDFDMDADDPLGRAPTAQEQVPQPESERRPLATAVSGALGGLGAAGGGAQRSRLMGIAGALLIVVGIITAVLAVVVGLNRSGDTTVPIAAADADPAAEAAVESESAVAGILADDQDPGDTPVATPVAEAPDAGAPGAGAPGAEAPTAQPVAAQPPVVAPAQESGEGTSPETDSGQTEASSAPGSVAEAGPVEEPAATAEEPEAPAPETPSEEAAVEAEGAETPVVEEPPEIESPTLVVPDFKVPDGPAPDYGWVSYWPVTQVYTITQGDTITSLAEQFDTHAYAIMCLNTRYWFDSQRVFTMIVGDALVIPAGYTIPGDDQRLYQYLQTGFLLRRCG